MGLRRPVLLGHVLMPIRFSGPVAPSQAHSGMSALQVAYPLRIGQHTVTSSTSARVRS